MHSNPTFLTWHVILAQAVCDVLRHRHVRKQRVALEDSVNVAPIGREVSYLIAADVDAATVRQFKAADHPQNRRLAGARRSQQGNKASSGDSKSDTVHGLEVAERFAHFIEPDVAGHGTLSPIRERLRLRSRSPMIAIETPLGLTKPQRP